MTTNNIPTDNIVSKIKGARKKAKITQEQFASRYQIPLRTLQSWELSERNPPEYIINTLLRCMEIDFGVKLIETSTPDIFALTYTNGTPLSLVDEEFVNAEKANKKVQTLKLNETTGIGTYRCSNGFIFRAKRV